MKIKMSDYKCEYCDSFETLRCISETGKVMYLCYKCITENQGSN